MSYVDTVETKGKRSLLHCHNGQLTTMPNRKYYTMLNVHLTPGHLTKMLAPAIAAYDGAAVVYAGSVAENDYLMGSAAGTNVTPFVVSDCKLKVRLRNNGTTDANIVLYEIEPRSVIPDTLPSAGAGALTVANVIPRAIFEGIADKFSAASMETSGFCMIHSGDGTGTEIGVLNDEVQYDELSLIPQTTIFDSAVFTSLFRIKKATRALLKPGDGWTYITRLNGQAFLDGIQNYMGAETLALPFSQFLMASLQGDIGHDSTANIFGLPNATPATRQAGRKQGVANVGYTDAVVDWLVETELSVEIFDATLITPGIAVQHVTEMNQGATNKAYTQAVDDLN